MRLWHIDLIDILPRQQLLGQWRELNSIFKKQDKHILINYIYKYNKSYLKNYSIKVIDEMFKRNYKINSFYNYDKYFNHDNCFINSNFVVAQGNEEFSEHNKDYLLTCFINLREKYKCGQKDFSKEEYERLRNYIYKRYNGKDGKITIDLYNDNFQEE